MPDYNYPQYLQCTALRISEVDDGILTCARSYKNVDYSNCGGTMDTQSIDSGHIAKIYILLYSSFGILFLSILLATSVLCLGSKRLQ